MLPDRNAGPMVKGIKYLDSVLAQCIQPEEKKNTHTRKALKSKGLLCSIILPT